MRSTQYDVWRCSRCNREKVVASRPHISQSCCGTGMWWDRFVEGPAYSFDPTNDASIEDSDK